MTMLWSSQEDSASTGIAADGNNIAGNESEGNFVFEGGTKGFPIEFDFNGIVRQKSKL